MAWRNDTANLHQLILKLFLCT
jgi:hypothetical protein